MDLRSRRRAIAIEPQALLDWFKGGQFEIASGQVPADAMLLGVYYESLYDKWVLTYCSETLQKIDSGQCAEEHAVEVRLLEPQPANDGVSDLSAQRLTLRPGDVVVLKVPYSLSPSGMQHLLDSASRAFPGHKCVVLEGGINVTVVGREAPPA